MSPIYNNFLQLYLTRISLRAHHIYALMLGLPKENFYLIRHYDYKNNIRISTFESPTTYSLQEYLSRKDEFHAQDTFVLYFDANLDLGDDEDDCTSIDTQEESPLPLLRYHVNIFLKVFCEQQLRRNTPFELSSGTIAKYGFTTADVKELRKSVTLYNKAAKERIRAEYDELYKLDFIRNGE